MNRYAAAARNYDNASPDEADDARDEAIEARKLELIDAFLIDYAKVREAFAEVVCQDADNIVGIDFATAFCAWHDAPDNVAPENIVGRFHAFMREMLPKLRAHLEDAAHEQASREIEAEDERNADDAAEARGFRISDDEE